MVFWPNVVWGGFGTRLLSDASLTSPFEAVSASNGVALVRNLPVEATEYAVSHPKFEMPTLKTPWGAKVRAAIASLTAGQTNETLVRLQKPGTEVIRN